MPRSCPPLRSDEVGWHGRRVRTRLRLILERVFWFVNGGMSQMFVGDDGACAGATDGWPFGEVRVVYGREVLRCAQNDIWWLGSGLRRKDGRRGRGLRGFGGFRRLMERWVGGMSQTGEEGFETSSLHPGHVPLMKSAALSAMASTVRFRFARTVSGMIDASMMRSPSTP